MSLFLRVNCFLHTEKYKDCLTYIFFPCKICIMYITSRAYYIGSIALFCLLSGACSLAAGFADEKKPNPPVVPAMNCRLLSIGDHWVYELNSRTPRTNRDPNQDGSIAALLHLRDSDNFRARLDIEVIAVPPSDDLLNVTQPVGDASPAGDASPDTSDNTSTPSNNAPNASLSSPAVPVVGDDQNIQSGESTKPLAFLMNLTYTRDGKEFSDYITYIFAQNKLSGKLLMESTTNDAFQGEPVPGAWGIGKQWDAFFPVDYPNFLAPADLSPTTATATVIGSEKLKLKAGDFVTWKVAEAQPNDHFNYGILSDYWWFDPSVVFPVRAEISYEGGRKFFLTLTLAETASRLVTRQKSSK